MAIVFTQQNKKQKMLLWVLVASLIVTGFVLYFGFFSEQKTPSEIYIEENTQAAQEEIKIDFTVLQNPLLKDLQSFSEIQPLQSGTSTSAAGNKGRENPFLPF